ncbi:MAG: ABC transporter permease [Mycobacterium leprae]
MTLAVYRASLRLTLRSVWVWAVTLPMLLFAWFVSTMGYNVTQFVHEPFFSVFFLGQMMATVAYAQMERAARVDELLEALPYRSAPVLIGRAVSFYTVWLVAGTLVYVVSAGITVLVKHGAFTALLLWDWLWVLPMTLVFTTGLAYGIGAIMRRGFGAYLVCLLLFLAGSFPFNQAVSSMAMDWFRGGPVTMLDFTLSSYFPLSQRPVFPDGDVLFYNRVHALALGLFWLVLVAWVCAGRRREGRRRWAGVTAVAMLVVVTWAFAGSRGIWAGRVAQMQIEDAAVTAKAQQPVSPVAAPQVGAYAVSLTLQEQGLRGQATLDIRRVGETATFTLNRVFTVTSVIGPDGSAVPFARSGDLLLLTSGGRTGSYRVDYAGVVWQWRRDYWGGMRLASHVAAESVMLPTSLGWYPLPGSQTLNYRAQTPSVLDASVSHPPVPFRLAVQGVDGLHLISNALDGQVVSAAWLIGTQWVPVTEQGIEFAVSPANRYKTQQFATKYGSELDWYQQLLPLNQPFQVVEVPDALWAVETLEPTAGFPGAMVVPTGLLGRLDNMQVRGRMLGLWWNDGRTLEEKQVHDVLKLFMAETYQQEVNNRPRVPMVLGVQGRTAGTATPEGKQLLADLHQFEQTRGLAATGNVLQSLHQSTVPLTWAQVEGALREGQP